VNSDPTQFLGGSANLYAYAENDPINAVDVDGKNPLLIIGGGALIGAGFGAWNEYQAQCKQLNLQVLRSAAGGFVAGGIGSGIGLLASGMGWTFGVITGMTGGAASSLVNSWVSGHKPNMDSFILSAGFGGAFSGLSPLIAPEMEALGFGVTGRSWANSVMKGNLKQQFGGRPQCDCK
jgi:hypothetical protein